MDLLDAIEELEEPTNALHSVHQTFDFVERQVLFVQQKLRDFWRKKHDRSADRPCIPFYWVFSKLLRLIEEYPAGLTEAVIITELTKLLKQKEDEHSEKKTGTLLKKRKIQHVEAMEDLLFEDKQEVLHAKVIDYGNHRLTLEMENVTDVTIYIDATFPFQTGCEVLFTNAKLLERKEVDRRLMDEENHRVKFTLLPTAFLTIRLDEDRMLDRKLLADAISLSQVNQLVGEVQDPTVIQLLMPTAKVLDIGAIRPCQTPLYVHRQVILLGEVDPTNTRVPGGAAPNTQRLTQGLHLMVLWDDQVALSRLFCVGDTLTIFHPFVHVCDQHDTEILHVLNEYSSQQRLTYYFEYGSATVLFSKSCRVSAMNNSTKTSAILQEHSEMERPLSHLDEIKPGWHDFSLYAHVRSIKVSHGIPLLAAFFYAYYDPKTNQPGAMNAKMLLPPPLDHTIVSRYYLVVMLQVYIASSKRLLTIEVTGENALAALRLLPGQSVFFDGLMAIDMQSKPVRRFRERGLMPIASASATKADFAFPMKAYSTSLSSGVVVLCSDWESIFGKQSLFNSSSKLTTVNTTPGLLNTALDRSATLYNVAAHALSLVEMTVSGIGWLIPSDNLEVQGFTLDTTCEKGHATTCAHKSCFRPLEMMTREQQTSGLRKWKCVFCQEIFFGLQDTVQTYSDLVVILQNGRSKTSPLVVLCHGETVESLLGLRAEVYVELPLAEKRKTLELITGTSFRLLLSRCEPRHISIPTTSFRITTLIIHLRIDILQPINTFAAAHHLLSKLQYRM
ncbi:hypothetical protein DD237_002935 [Peronospora effusa]|uniref:Uncharacterized protein n=1 Tax=Peronospora effusa TaxID=542832 RepID=A0A3R7WNF2_9STRA|nr:hypothetical protein DD237_002935 [Peronospora effusa]